MPMWGWLLLGGPDWPIFLKVMAPARSDYSKLALGYPAGAMCSQQERRRVTSRSVGAWSSRAYGRVELHVGGSQCWGINLGAGPRVQDQGKGMVRTARGRQLATGPQDSS